MKYIYIFLSLIILTSFSSDKKISLSSPLDKISIGKTKIKDVKNLLGEPDTLIEKNMLANLGGWCLDLSYTEMRYENIGVNFVFRSYCYQPQKRKIDELILYDNSTIALNETIKLNTSTRTNIKDMFGEHLYTDTIDSKIILCCKIRSTKIQFNIDETDTLRSLTFIHQYK